MPVKSIAGSITAISSYAVKIHCSIIVRFLSVFLKDTPKAAYICLVIYEIFLRNSYGLMEILPRARYTQAFVYSVLCLEGCAAEKLAFPCDR